MSDNGTIAVNAKTALGTTGFIVSLTPSWTGQTVNWACNSNMNKYAPSSCRGV